MNRWIPNPNRHLWNNNGTWWMRIAPYDETYRYERQAISLNTHDVQEARRRRDEMISANKWRIADQ